MKRCFFILVFFFIGKDVNYFVERQLGSGAFAKVYLVTTRDPESDRDHVETDDESCVVFKVFIVFYALY